LSGPVEGDQKSFSSKGDQRSSAMVQRTPSAKDRFLALPARARADMEG
jgi:hypothetical protein